MAKAVPIRNHASKQTVLAEDIRFRGELRFKDSLQINGKFDGRITTNGHLILSDKAEVRADIEANSVSISGHLVGNIIKSNRVHLYGQSVVRGDIYTKDLIIESGSRFDGTCIMSG